MYFIIFITFIVILILWLLSDIKNTQLIYAQPIKKPVKPPAQQVKPPTQPKLRQPQPQQPSLVGRGSSTTMNLAPTKERLAKALAAYTKNNKSGKVSSSSSYKDLVDNGYLYYNKKDKKWYSNPNPSGQPAVGSGKPVKPSVSGPSGGGSNQGGGHLSAPQAYTANPHPKTRYTANVGGYASPTLFQWTNSGVQLSPDGRSLTASVNRQSKDGAGNNDDISRNEIALKPDNIRDVKSVSFTFQGSGYNKNLLDNMTGIFFQVKPLGDNNGFRLGIKGGNLAIGYSKKVYNKGTPIVVTDSSGKPINMNVPHKFDVKLNGLSGTLLVDGKPVYLNGKTVAKVKSDPSMFKVQDGKTQTGIKFGLEVPDSSWDKQGGGTVKGQYNDISINGL